MNIACGCLMCVFGCAALWSWIGLLRDRINFKECNSDRTTAWLASAKRLKPIYTRNDGVLRNAVDAQYDYMVDGKKYTRSHRFFESGPNGVPRKGTVVYQKKHPERAYLESFTGQTKETRLDKINRPADGGALTFLGVGTILFFAVALQFFFS